MNIITALAGKRSTGKTTYAKKLITHHPKKVLICDTVDHPSYREYQSITINMLPGWKSGIKRIFSSDTDAVLEAISKYVHNALIVFEDSTKYIDFNVPPSVKHFLVDSKQKNLDIIFIYHSLRRIPPSVYEMIDYIGIWKTNDVMTGYNAKIPDYHIIKEVQERVKAHPNQYYHEIIKIG